MTLRVKRLHEDAKLPTKAHDGDLGYDLYALENTVIRGGSVGIVDTGIACDFPDNYGALIRDRSSVATKANLLVVAGVIDNGYKGQIKVAFHNPLFKVANSPGQLQSLDVEIQKGDKIAQMILMPVVTMPVEEVDELTDSSRGTGGFGSTGA
jgi:dUTP pyrophosphatase